LLSFALARSEDLIPFATLWIMSPLGSAENPEKDVNSSEGAALSAGKVPIDPDLELIIHKWTDLPQTLKAGILAMVRATDQYWIVRGVCFHLGIIAPK